MTGTLPWYRQPVREIDRAAVARAKERQRNLTKPPGSLGALERLAVRACGWMGDAPSVHRPAVVVFAADHGVVEEGVSAFPQAVTGEMIRNFSVGGAAISVLAGSLGAMLEVVHLGTVNDPGPLPGVVRTPVASRSANFLHGPAMTADQLDQSLAAGRQAVERFVDRGADLLACGEMGIGNTTCAAALTCAYLELPAKDVTGPGTGLDAAGVAVKARVVAGALALHREGLSDPLSVLQRLGGFEVAALTGAFIAAAQSGLPVLVDGFIASAAALAAIRIQPSVAEWMQTSHLSAEPGHAPLVAALAEETGSPPLLDLGMRLGEGSGAALAIPLVKLALTLHREMATFAEAGVSGAGGR